MSIFSRIKDAIFGSSAKVAPSSAAQSKASPSAASSPAVTQSPTAPATPSPASIDVEAVLEQLAHKQNQKLNWRTSIVDLMKLVGLDSSLENRKELAKELGYTGDTADSASMNIWLHKQVMKELAKHGGKVPEELKS